MVTRIEYLKMLGENRKAPRKGRKQATPAAPTIWWRSPGGRPFKIRKTPTINAADEWLYRADYGNVVGSDTWSWPDLERMGCTQLDGQPDDWVMAEYRLKKDAADDEIPPAVDWS